MQTNDSALHEESIGSSNGCRFNHTAVTESSWFNKTVPNYYYRQDEEEISLMALPVANVKLLAERKNDAQVYY